MSTQGRAQFTPGPWAVSDDGDVTLIIHAPKDEVDIARMSNDCEMFSEIRTNAHLIAAAPAMYGALQSILEFYEWSNSNGAEQAAYDKAMAALAQAEGRQT